MKRWVAVFSIVLVCCGVCGATVSVVKNGSFENGVSGYMDVTPSSIPQYWCNVSYEMFKFYAYIANDWATDDSYSLTLYAASSADTGKTFVQGDSAILDQAVNLTHAGQMIFDLRLYSDRALWSTSIVTAGVLIDGSEVWNSDGLTYTSGQFTGQVAIDINETFKDGKPHIVSLQLKADISGYYSFGYIAQWDAIRLSAACGSLPADLTNDCVVDINDLIAFTDLWLQVTAGPDLTGDSFIDFADFAVLADSWMVDNRGEPFIPEPGFVFLDGDLNDDGIVDYFDIALFSENWLGEGGSCVREDLNADGFIDFTDLALLAGKWQEIGGLYGL